MNKYKVVKTEVGTCWAKNDHDATELANEAFFDAPEATYTITDITPRHNLAEIQRYLEADGWFVYYDDYRNNSHDFLRIDFTNGETDEARFIFGVILDDHERYDGAGYYLRTDDEDLATWSHLSPSTVALLAGARIAQYEADKPRPEATKPNTATLEAIGEHLTALGETVRVHYEHRFEGQKPWLEIGAYDDEDRCHEFTLYYNLENGDGGDIGEGWFVTNDCRNLVWDDIPNLDAQAVAYIAKGILTARRAGN